MKLVHAADLHVDSPLSGLARYGGAPVELIRSATRRALENLVDFCASESVALLLLAGDLFDGDWRDYTTGLFFAEQMARLKRADVRVVVVRGNHDAASQITKHLALPDNVFELSARHPETVSFTDLGVAVHGQSYARRAETEDLARAYPDAVPGMLNIGLLHTCVSGRVGHEPYAPCRIDTLLSKGYDYWALGHVHQREVLSENPWIVFSGNLQGRHIKELGPKGATVLEVSGGRITDVAHRAFDVVRWERAEIEIQADWDVDRVVDATVERIEELLEAAGDRALVIRVALTGQTGLHGALERDHERWEAQIRARASEFERVWVESVRFCTQPQLAFAELRQRGDALGQLARSLAELKTTPGGLEPWLGQFADLRDKLPPEVREGPEGLRLDDVAVLKEALSDVETLLLTRLLEAGDTE
jgi:DNA repair exonuclease SbcCD nuclease subunit